MLSKVTNLIRLLSILSDVTGSVSRVRTVLAVALLDLALSVTYDSTGNVTIMLGDLDNLGLAFGISTLPSLQAEILLVPVYWLSSWRCTSGQILPSWIQLHRLVRPQKHGGCRWNYTSIMSDS